MATAPLERLTVTIIGSISGVSPTATERAKRKASNQRPRARPLKRKTSGTMGGAEALAAAGLKPVELSAKEGLALINGTQAMTAAGALAAYDARKLIRTADLAASITAQALRGIVDAYDPRIHALRNQIGQEIAASNMPDFVDGILNIAEAQAKVAKAYLEDGSIAAAIPPLAAILHIMLQVAVYTPLASVGVTT